MHSCLPSKRATFTYKEKLKLKKDIDKLFQIGKAFSIEPYRIAYRFVVNNDETNFGKTQAGFSVPKKRFKKAVCRNKVKRLTREAWRINKYKLTPYMPNNIQVQLFFIYQNNAILPYAAIEKATEAITQKLIFLLQKEFTINE